MKAINKIIFWVTLSFRYHLYILLWLKDAMAMDGVVKLSVCHTNESRSHFGCMSMMDCGQDPVSFQVICHL